MRLTRMFGLAVLAALAMSAVAASAASAAEFFHEAEAEAGETTARVVATNEGIHSFTAGLVGTIECKKATFTGTEFVPSPRKTVTVTPAYSECTFLKVTGVVVKTNGCTYTFNQPTGAGPFTGSVNVNCPKGSAIEFEANGCTVKVSGHAKTETEEAENQGLNSVTFTNLATAPKTVKVGAKVTGIAYTASGSCAVIGLFKNGEYNGTAIAKAETPNKITVGAFIK
jgi:hypothetical protein